MPISSQEDYKEIYFVFSDFYSILMNFRNLNEFRENLNQKLISIMENGAQCTGRNGPTIAAHSQGGLRDTTEWQGRLGWGTGLPSQPS
jgi:hypothetical protein